MTREPASADGTDLAEAAYWLAEEYRSGQLTRFECPEWASTWQNLVTELERRVPGYAADAYGLALEHGFVETR